jgi:hypothetical protein
MNCHLHGFWQPLGNRLYFLYEDVLKDEILASVGNLRLIVIISLEGLWFLLEDVLKIIIFLHGEIFEFPCI